MEECRRPAPLSRSVASAGKGVRQGGTEGGPGVGTMAGGRIKSVRTAGTWNGPGEGSLAAALVTRMAGGVFGLDGAAWEEAAPIHNLIAEQHLIDPYKTMQPTSKAFSYLERNRSQHISASRIDFFLISENLQGAVQATGTSDLPYSPGLDHKFTYLHLILEAAAKRGPDFFKVNNSLLDTQIMKEHIIETCEAHGTFPHLVWGLSIATAKASRILATRRAVEYMSFLNKAEREEGLGKYVSTGVVTLLYKKGDPANIKNYRPITLLTVVYKLLANRLSRITSRCFHIDQTGFIPGRFIIDNVMTLVDSARYIKDKQLNVAILFFDFEKAYDQVNWNFQQQCMERIGVGPNFRRWVRVLYSDAHSQVQVNGFFSTPFKMTRSVRQGDPLAAPPFLFTLEAIASFLRKDPTIDRLVAEPSPPTHAVTLPTTLLFVDDLTAVVKASEASLQGLTRAMQVFHLASEMKVNWHKRMGWWVADCMPPPQATSPEGFEWQDPRTPLRFLGIKLSETGPNQAMVPEILTRMLCKMDTWSSTYMSVFGRALVLNASVFSML
ncbi:hypothetical protein CBR_g49716 [Chara braunii]|uniref:Reverse transcriptase domain-containing protein n=1 Tax=Chara braunii TaxID=69332 RepID=A0A388M5K7_CHABU|nr:hypothetical protein CBR_g49716 [Chara braunii]|eukprot:GBG89868.1 hypothetical protein CBR_g49716 [Chara braunii]